MATFLVAVSGGVDSVVLLDILARQQKHRLVVAHVDHGIRDDSGEDERFVRRLAAEYDLPFVSTTLQLGKEASEEQARQRRYKFLNEEAKNHQATLLTAHHLDDLVETIAINLVRGTGHRGVAVLNREGMCRPLLPYSKSHIYQYALTHRLEWVEDSTNHDTKYLRNALRHKTHVRLTSTDKKRLYDLRERQIALHKKIASETDRLLSKPYSRYMFSNVDPKAADELFIAVCKRENLSVPVRSQRERAILAIKTSKPGKTTHIGDRVRLICSLKNFIVRTS